METRANHRSEVGVLRHRVWERLCLCVCVLSLTVWWTRKGLPILSHELMITDTFTHTQICKPCSLCVCFLFCYFLCFSFYFSHHLHLLKMLLYSCLLSFCIVRWPPSLVISHYKHCNLIVISIFVLFLNKKNLNILNFFFHPIGHFFPFL